MKGQNEICEYKLFKPKTENIFLNEKERPLRHMKYCTILYWEQQQKQDTE